MKVTRFRCGGVSLGIGSHAYVGDAQILPDFMNSWSRIARGEEINIHPYIDRTILQARDPPTPVFPHQDQFSCHPSLKNKDPSQSSTTSKSMFKVTRAQLDSMKARCKGEEASTFVSLTIHVWQCLTRSRHLSDDQETKLVVPLSGRQRLGLPSGYIGNVTFLSTVTLKAAQVVAGDVSVLARKIKESFDLLTEEHMRSAIDYLELQTSGKTLRFEKEKGEEEEEEEEPSIFVMNNMSRLPYYDADFGWGKPIYVGPAMIRENVCAVLPSFPTNGEDGSAFIVIELKEDQMLEFQKLFYMI